MSRGESLPLAVKEALINGVYRFVRDWRNEVLDLPSVAAELSEAWELLEAERDRRAGIQPKDPRDYPHLVHGRTWLFLSDGLPHNLEAISEYTGSPQQAAGANTRDLRKEKWGAWLIPQVPGPGRTTWYQNVDPRLWAWRAIHTRPARRRPR